MQRVLITGANRGVGLGLVQAFMAEGTPHIIATCRQPQDAHELQALAEQQPDQVHILPLDIADPTQVDALPAQVAPYVDALDVVINNAGINPNRPAQQLDSITREMLHEVFDVNAVSTLFVTKALLPLLRRGKDPRLMNVSTQVGSMTWKTNGGSYAYAASKAALNMITRCLAADLQGAVTVITVHPGWVQTAMGGSNAPLTIEDSAQSLYRLLAGLTPEDNGRFFKWNGEPHPW